MQADIYIQIKQIHLKINDRNSVIKCNHRSNEPNRRLQKFNQNNTEYSLFFSASDGTFSRTDHVLGYKASVNKYRNIEIIRLFFLSDHNGIRLQINNEKLQI